MNDIYTWHNDLYPLVKKRFDLRYAKRLDVIARVTDVVCRDDIDYRLEGCGKCRFQAHLHHHHYA